MWGRVLPVFFCISLIAFAQEETWQIGAAGGYGFYNGGRVTSEAGNAQASARNRFAAGAVLTEDRFEHLSGEARFTYQDGDPFLKARGIWLHVRGMSYTFTYEMLIHTRNREQKVRPYIALGAGAKLYRTDWPRPLEQPLADIAVMTMRDDWRFVGAVGIGVQWRVHRHMILRFDFRDYISQFPRTLIEPAPRSASREVFHQFTPLFGISYPF